jgi:sucrose phosphorylase
VDTAEPLKRRAAIRPANAFTVLDTHDGTGIVDIGADASDREARPGLVPPAELDQLVERIHQASGGQSRRATGAAASNLDLYQVNCTYFDALGGDEEAYLMARALQFFLPGIPQVYDVGLLAGRNDMALLEATGVGRDIYRQRFDRAGVEAALRRRVVQRLLALIRLRNEHPAFGGRFEVQPSSPQVLVLRWQAEGAGLEREVDFAAHRAALREAGAEGRWLPRPWV